VNKKYKITPLFFILINLIAGLCIQYNFNLKFLNYFSILAICAIILIIILSFQKKIKIKKIIIKSCVGYYFIFAGIYLFNLQQSEAIAIREKILNKNISTQCKVIEKQPTSNFLFKEIIKINVKKFKYEDYQSGRTHSTTLRANGILEDIPNWENENFDLQIYLREESNLEVDDLIEIPNLEIKPVNIKSISGNQNFNDYLIKENIAGTIFINNLEYTLTSRPEFSINRWISNKRLNILHSIKNKLSKKTMSLYSCVFLGEKKENYGYVKHSRHLFNYWGIAHFLARAGIHVAILIFIWKLLINLLPLSFFLKHLILLLFSLIYAYLSFPSITFTRAILIFMAFEIGKLINKRPNFLHTLILICLSILMLNPYQLFFVDFQLSFAITFALSYFSRIRKT